MSRRPVDPDERAADFVVEGDDPQSADERQLVGWLAESPRNVAEYMRASALWEALADPDLALDAPPARRTLHRTWWAYAAAAVIVLALGGAWWAITRPEVHRTNLGEVTSFPLADRSVVFLNADSRLSVHYSEVQRRVVLHSGEAVFEVAADLERPFVVVSGAARVTAVGTKFAVRRRSGETTVTLIEGKVVVKSQSAVALEPGQRLTMEDSGSSTVARVDPAQVAPWRHRRLVFDDEPLAEVAAAFNRFNQPPLRVEGDGLRQLRISGVFAANDPESLLAYLRTLDGVEVRIEPDGSATVRLVR